MIEKARARSLAETLGEDFSDENETKSSRKLNKTNWKFCAKN